MTGGIVDLEGNGGAGVCVCVCEFSSSFNFRCCAAVDPPAHTKIHHKITQRKITQRKVCAWTLDTVKLGICGLINVANNGSRSLDAQTAF
jgi:hypothetical protein